MRKRIFSIFLAVAMIFCIIPLSAYADEHQHTFENKHGYDLSNLPEGYSIPCKIYESPCSSECGYSLYSWDVFGLSGQFVDKTGTSGLVVYQHYREWFEKIYGRNATASKYETGGGSAGTGGAGRRPSGYADDNGIPSINSAGNLAFVAKFRLTNDRHHFVDSFSITDSGKVWTFGPSSIQIESLSTSESLAYVYGGYVLDTQNISGIFYVPQDVDFVYNLTGYYYLGSYGWLSFKTDSISSKSVDGSRRYLILYQYSKSSKKPIYRYCDENGDDDLFLSDSSYYFNYSAGQNLTLAYPEDLVVYCCPTTTTVNKQTNITINNNTWSGNIYQDNSTNLTYIYPQYTTVNENNETVTNISNNPIIYNNETKEYYTYDSVTNNYYYITYVTETPTPTPSPDPGTDPTPTPEPGGDTGDTTGVLAVLVEIRDNLIQGFADLKATLVQGWADLSANFTLAIENLNLNITNIFNKKFPDQSTPETAQPSPSPSPSPDPSPSPTPDPDNPDATPTPTPPTTKPSGSTNNFWNFVFPGGNDDGTENGHKGILWALISLLIAVVTFVLGLGSAYSYVFPFLPAGLVTTIHICVLVLLLFAIIKFVRSFL